MHLLQQRMEEEGGKEEREYQRQSAEELFKIEQYGEMALHYARLDSMSSDMLLKKHDISVIVRGEVKKYGVLFIGSGLGFVMEDFGCEAITDEKWIELSDDGENLLWDCERQLVCRNIRFSVIYICRTFTNIFLPVLL